MELETLPGRAETSSDEVKEPKPASTNENNNETVFPTGLKLGGCIVGLVFAASCYSLVSVNPSGVKVSVLLTRGGQDETIISTAIPRISDEFHAIGDIGWYGAAFLATMCICQPIFGRIYTACPTKHTFLIAALLFEIGNVVSGSAQSSKVVIAGRVITGAGCAGMNSGTWIIVSKIVPLRRRPILISCIGSIYGVAAIIGPLVGGILTQHVSWRWVFYINLPLGAICMASIAVFFRDETVPNSSTDSRTSLWNPPVCLSAIHFAAGIATLLLALQFGGVQYSWTNYRILVLFVVSAVCLVVFAALQIWRPKAGLVPLHIIRQRSVAAAVAYAFCAGAAATILIYYLPLWLQGVKGKSASQSGILFIPFLLGFVVFALCAGLLVSRTGYYVPLLLAGTILMSIGSGMFSTLSVSSNRAQFIGYQFLFAAGTGFGNNQPLTAVQKVLGPEDVPLGPSMVAFAQTFGAAVFLVVAQNVFVRHLLGTLRAAGWSVSAEDILSVGATKLLDAAGKQGGNVSADALLQAYSSSVTATFWVVLGLSLATAVGSISMEWRSVRKDGGKKTECEIEDGEGGTSRTSLT